MMIDKRVRKMKRVIPNLRGEQTVLGKKRGENKEVALKQRCAARAAKTPSGQGQ